MAKTYFVRTEPRTTTSDLDAGLAALVHDPAWMLGRQWQLGEFGGEDAGSPVSATLAAETAMVSGYRPRDRGALHAYDPREAPLEAMVEAEAQRTASRWTARLRIDTGRAFLRALDDRGLAAQVPAFRTAFPIAPASDALRAEDPAGDRLLAVAAGRIPDGQQLYLQFVGPLRNGTAIPATAGVDADPDILARAAQDWLAFCDDTISEGTSAAWRPRTLDHAFALATGKAAASTLLEATSNGGGSLEWHSFDARPGGGSSDFKAITPISVVPTGVRFRGMPNARWWEMEDATVDMGSVDAGPSDVARLAFLEYALVYGNDFFAVPLRLPIGSLTRVTSLVVADTFGMKLSIESANRRQGKQGATRFCLFALSERSGSTAGGDDVSDVLFLAPVSGQMLSTAAVEDVLLLRDEMANLAWAVERRYEGERGLPVERHETAVLAAPERAVPGRDATLTYRLGTEVPPYWFPLIPTLASDDVSLVLSRISNQPATVVPHGRLLAIGGPPIPDAEVPREGTRLLRDTAMTRWSNGRVFVWSRRRREIGRGEGSSGLRFDVAEHE